MSPAKPSDNLSMTAQTIDLSSSVKALRSSRTYDEAKAVEVAAGVEGFAAGSAQLLVSMEQSLER